MRSLPRRLLASRSRTALALFARCSASRRVLRWAKAFSPRDGLFAHGFFRLRPVAGHLCFLVSLAACIIGFVDGHAHAEHTPHFHVDSATEFNAGSLAGAIIRSDGSLVSGQSTTRHPIPGMSVVRAHAIAPDGAIYLGGDQDGSVYRWANGVLTLVARTGDAVVTSLTIGFGGDLFVGSMPGGSIRRVSLPARALQAPVATQGGANKGGGKAAASAETSKQDTADRHKALPPPPVFAKLEETQAVWQLLFHPGSQTIFAATGPHGRIHRIDAGGRATLHYEDKAAPHIMAIALQGDDRLLAGTSDTAELLAMPLRPDNASSRGPVNAKVLWNFPGNEITAIAVLQKTIAVVANTFPSPPPAKVASPALGASAQQAAAKGLGAIPLPKKGSGSLWIMQEGRGPERLLFSKKTHFSALAFESPASVSPSMKERRAGSRGEQPSTEASGRSPGQATSSPALLVSTGQDGKLVRTSLYGGYEIIADTGARQILTFDMSGPQSFVATSDGAALLLFDDTKGKSRWESKVFDAGHLAQWGAVRGRVHGKPVLESRSGNLKDPSRGWSPWQTLQGPEWLVQSPSARFMQLRATLGRQDTVFGLEIYYRTDNQRPVLTSLDTKRSAPKPGVPASIALTWKLRNPDNDAVRYRIFFRQEGQASWRPLFPESKILKEPKFTWTTSGVADGRYVLRVVASDELDQPPARARKSETLSEPIVVDNHPPVFAPLSHKDQTIKGRVRDDMGPIRRLTYAVDGRRWHVIDPEDGLLDQNEEGFSLKVPAGTPAGSIISIKAEDAAGHQATTEMVWTQP